MVESCIIPPERSMKYSEISGNIRKIARFSRVNNKLVLHGLLYWDEDVFQYDEQIKVTPRGCNLSCKMRQSPLRVRKRICQLGN